MLQSLADKAIKQISKADQERFWNKVSVEGPSVCWEWQAGKQKSSGHAVFSIKGQCCFAHRVAFFITHGYLPALIMHDCENPGCCNPNHLLEGTPKENGNYPGCVAKCRENVKDRPWFGTMGEAHPRWGMKHSNATKDKIRKAAIKRGGWHKGFKRSAETRARISAVTRGENSCRALLTEDQVVAIFYSPERNIVLARQYNIDPSQISLIKNRKTWKHITCNL